MICWLAHPFSKALWSPQSSLRDQPCRNPAQVGGCLAAWTSGQACSDPTAASVHRHVVVAIGGALGGLVLLERAGLVPDAHAHAGGGDGEEDEARVAGSGSGEQGAGALVSDGRERETMNLAIEGKEMGMGGVVCGWGGRDGGRAVDNCVGTAEGGTYANGRTAPRLPTFLSESMVFLSAERWDIS